MDTAEGADLAKVQARRAKHKARGINGNGFGESLSEKAQMWPSARAEDSESSGRRHSREVSDTLTAAARDWAAPTQNDFKRGEDSNRANRRHDGAPLTEQAAEWRAPQCGDASRGPKSQRGANYGYRDQSGMHSLVSQTTHWPGPAARDHKGVNSIEHVTENSTGSMHLDQLPNFVEFCFLPPSSPAPTMPQDGETSSTATPNTSPPSPRRKLNPIFVEALMRWPTGLSGFERQETAWTRWWQLMPSYLSALCSRPPEPKQGSLF